MGGGDEETTEGEPSGSTSIGVEGSLRADMADDSRLRCSGGRLRGCESGSMDLADLDFLDRLRDEWVGRRGLGSFF